MGGQVAPLAGGSALPGIGQSPTVMPIPIVEPLAVTPIVNASDPTPTGVATPGAVHKSDALAEMQKGLDAGLKQVKGRTKGAAGKAGTRLAQLKAMQKKGGPQDGDEDDEEEVEEEEEEEEKEEEKEEADEEDDAPSGLQKKPAGKTSKGKVTKNFRKDLRAICAARERLRKNLQGIP